MHTLEQHGRLRIEFDGFDEWPALRRDLLAFINVFCADMTLAQAREWFDDAFPGASAVRP
jgi:hypothetical protein